MKAVANTVVAAPVIKDVTITLSKEEAMILRRACNFNKTVADKFRNSQYGGYSKSQTLKRVFGSIGDHLKAAGIERY